ncbi:hemerythrin domain-containing protein [Primorskyibacter aestuariivivens]|uniref:hemerythrin domain-containing protein n=1 Tax=Primorskyibacter aestuariivivens TaxID=1888912 RepID=UPI002300E6EC|nr:hemerythrin domain-containing protein [Primorskyibacter aestuariivivens]MDA7428100.1 hemerythrin domain-containing protein [Primorskyibacter aestuariivivens]
MEKLTLETRTGLPDALRVLLAEYPRADWPAHDNFHGLVSFWLERHLMFRKLLEALASDCEAVMDVQMDPRQHGQRLQRYGSMLVSQLHGHHQIEDMHYFPKLVGMEARLERGFTLLDADHHALDGLLARFTEAANGVLRGGEPGRFHTELKGFAQLIDRHLVDEEELIVPVILKHGVGGLE